MSIQAVAWVLDHSLTKKLDRLVLISLANHANDEGECWPSVQLIAHEAGTSALQARRTLGALEEAGHISRAINAAPDQRIPSDRRPNLYRILDGGSQKVPPWLERGRVERPNGGTPSARTGARGASERGRAVGTPNHQEPSEEPSQNLLVVAEASSFDAFWDAYPRKDEKRRAETAWGKATKTADRKTIIDAARAYAADPNRMDQFTKQAPTWLNGECWNDPPLPSRTNATASIDRATERLKQRQAAGLPNFFDPGPPRQIAAGD